MNSFMVWVLTVALLANGYSLYKFWQALQTFTRSQQELDDLLRKFRE